ncbi:MAG: hypothetical protein OXP70_11580 [Acidobacteriota bacterium]|nr:hypothetical protein [Acidobacteriota bacterium]
MKWTLFRLGIAAVWCCLAHAACMTEPEEAALEPVVTELVVVHGDGQYQGRGRQLNEPVTVRAYDAGRQAVSGAKVEFRVSSGNGSLSNEFAYTDRHGAASSLWTLGDIAGLHTLTAAVGDGPNVEITATARPGDFDIHVVAGEGFSDEQRTAMRAAAERWTAVIVGDKPDYVFPVNFQPPTWCQDVGLAGAPGNGKIDDVRWDIVVAEMPWDIMTAPCHYRVGESGMTETLWFVLALTPSTVDDITEAVESPEVLQAWLSQELGRRLASRLVHLADDSNPQDVHFVDEATIAAFDAAGGANWTGGSKVPVQGPGVGGNANLAWRCSVFGHEMMSGVFPHYRMETGRRPLSAITVQLLAAFDYEVDVSKADPYTLPETPWANCFREEDTSHPLAAATVVSHWLPLHAPPTFR